MAKKEISKNGPKDLGTVKEVFCSGVAITTTGQKIFLPNVAKGDRIVEEDGKKKVVPKVEKPRGTQSSSKENTDNQLNDENVNDAQLGGELFNDGDKANE